MLFFMNQIHKHPRKDVCSINDDIGELMENDAQEENGSKPLELKVQARRIVRRCFNLP